MSTSSNTNYHHGDLKAALIEAAEFLIKEKGIEALSLRNIAAEVGVSHMAPYSHFKNKSELFQAVAASGFTELGNRMQEIKQDLPDPKELILLYGVEYITFATSNPELYKLMLIDNGGNPTRKAYLVYNDKDPCCFSSPAASDFRTQIEKLDFYPRVLIDNSYKHSMNVSIVQPILEYE